MDDTEGFYSPSRLGELTAKLAELPGAVVPPSLAAALAAFEASTVMPHRLRQALQQFEARAAPALLPLAAAVEGPFTRELQARAAALGEAQRRTNQAEALAAVRELLAARPLHQAVAAELRRPADERKRIAATLTDSAEPQEIEFRDYSASVLQPAPGNDAPAARPDRVQPPATLAAVVALRPATAPAVAAAAQTSAAAAAAPARAPATAGRGLIRTPCERWRNARGHWSDEVLAEADRLLSPSGGNHSEGKVAQALGIRRQSLQEALRRWTARADKGKAAASA